MCWQLNCICKYKISARPAIPLFSKSLDAGIEGGPSLIQEVGLIIIATVEKQDAFMIRRWLLPVGALYVATYLCRHFLLFQFSLSPNSHSDKTVTINHSCNYSFNATEHNTLNSRKGNSSLPVSEIHACFPDILVCLETERSKVQKKLLHE